MCKSIKVVRRGALARLRLGCCRSGRWIMMFFFSGVGILVISLQFLRQFSKTRLDSNHKMLKISLQFDFRVPLKTKEGPYCSDSEPRKNRRPKCQTLVSTSHRKTIISDDKGSFSSFGKISKGQTITKPPSRNDPRRNSERTAVIDDDDFDRQPICSCWAATRRRRTIQGETGLQHESLVVRRNR